MVVNPILNLAHVGTVRAETRMLCGLVFGSPAASQRRLGHDANVNAGFSCDDGAAKTRGPADPDISEPATPDEVLRPVPWWCLHLQCSGSLPCACCEQTPCAWLD